MTGPLFHFEGRHLLALRHSLQLLLATDHKKEGAHLLPMISHHSTDRPPGALR